MVQSGKIIPAETIVRMLRKIIYSGDGRKKFILTSFPDIIDQAREFERSCCTIAAIIYTTGEQGGSGIVEIKNNNLTLFNIDALFQKEHRLRTMAAWDEQKWAELLGNSKLDWSVVVGANLQGKSTLCGVLGKHLGFKVIDWKAVEEQVKKTLGTEEEPFEGKVPIDKVEAAVVALVQGDRRAGRRCQYVFDGFPLHATPDGFHQFTSQKLGSSAPDYVFDLRKGGVDATMALARHKKRAELEEVSEELQAEIRANFASSEDKATHYINDILGEVVKSGRVKVVSTLKSDACSEETQAAALKRLLKPRVILVNHEKRLGVDTTCANLAIKYNMVYLSAYQLIRQHIEEGTEFGKRLLATKKTRDIVLHTQTKDEFCELEYSAAHFDLDLVIELLQHTVASVRNPTQRFVLLEGMCNASRLAKPDDKMSLRLMDELWAIERNIGEVQAVIGLQFNSEKEYLDEDEIDWERFDISQTPRTEQAKPVEGDEAAAESQPPAEDPAAAVKKKNAFKPEDFQWTASDRKPRNLAQLFM